MKLVLRIPLAFMSAAFAVIAAMLIAQAATEGDAISVAVAVLVLVGLLGGPLWVMGSGAFLGHYPRWFDRLYNATWGWLLGDEMPQRKTRK